MHISYVLAAIVRLDKPLPQVAGMIGNRVERPRETCPTSRPALARSNGFTTLLVPHEDAAEAALIPALTVMMDKSALPR